MGTHTTHPGTRGRRAARRRRVLALGSAGLVLGIGAFSTLAAWTDTEWVFGGNGTGGPGVRTSTFEVQQNTSTPFDPGAWTDAEVNPGGEMVFTPGASAFSPGDTAYAPVALRTAPTSVAGTVQLQPAVAATGITVVDPDGLLLTALVIGVATSASPFTCDATAFDGSQGAVSVIAAGPLTTTGGSSTQSLMAASASTQHYCFSLELPDPLVPRVGFEVEDYMGLSGAPAWEFSGESA